MGYLLVEALPSVLADCRHYYGGTDLWALPAHEAMDLIRRLPLYYRVTQGAETVFVHSAIERWRDRERERASEQEPVASATELSKLGIEVRTVQI